MRIQLLEGRASEEQVREMCENLQEELQDNLTDLGNMLQDTPNYISDNMPPIVSEEPGCDDGLIPFESAEAAKVATITLTDALEKLKLEYVEDMMGDGGVPFTDADWGLLNMILSDTYGNPLTVHNTKASAPIGPVMDFITNEPIDWKDMASAFNPMLLFLLFIKPMPSIFQKSALPTSVAEWMREYLGTNSNPWHGTNNNWEGPETFSRTFKELGFNGFFGDDVDLTNIPDQGFNIKYNINFEDERVNVTRKGRKAQPDASLEYRDNCKGRKKISGESTFDHGFEIKMYLSELHKQGGEVANVPNNNVRINIDDVENLTAPGDLPSIFSLFNPMSFKTNTEEMFGALVGATLPDIPDEERKYEFFAIDPTFDYVDLSQYPDLIKTFEKSDSLYAPQVVLLREIIKQNNNQSEPSLTEVVGWYNSENTALLSSLSSSFADNNRGAYKYGAAYDNLTYKEFDYMAPMEYQTVNSDTHRARMGIWGADYTVDSTTGQYMNADTGLPGLLYADLEIYDPEAIGDGWRKVRNSDMIVGISRNQYNAQIAYSGDERDIFDNTRVFYLNPIQYGGSYKRPAMAVRPLKNQGWMGFVDAVFPPMADCPDTDDDLVDFGSIKKRIDDSYSRIPEDQRLKTPQECAIELPYNRILERTSKAGLESIISAAIQIYVGTHFVKCMPMYTFIKPSVPDNYSNMLVSYIVEVMEESLKDAQGPLRELFNTFKDNEFWYAFLEQSVQLYGRLVDDGQILEIPIHVQESITRLNDMQSVYDYPNRDDLIEAIKLGDEPWYQIFNLPGYRSEKNLEAVQATEEDAKIILAELVAREFNALALRMEDNLNNAGMASEYDKMVYWFLENKVGGANFNLKGPFTEDAANLAQPPEPYYTSGGELYISHKQDSHSEYTEGEDYIGYYHVHTDREGVTTYMVGKEHIEADHDILSPYENQIIVKNATGQGFGGVSPIGTAMTENITLHQYVSIDGARKTPAAATSEITSQPLGQNISDAYPGTLQTIFDDEGKVVGLEGELGVRNGLVFSYRGFEITSVEMDALDVKVERFQPAAPSSKLLLCLINALAEDERFKLFTEYIFPLNKFSALYAIYNDLALLPSIGEKIFDLPSNPEPGSLQDQLQRRVVGEDTDSNGEPLKEPWQLKPGAYFDTEAYAEYVKDNPTDYKLPDPFNLEGGTDSDGAPRYGGNPGWEEYSVRKPGGLASLFGSTTWDQWDQILLRNSKSRIKQIFKSYYYARDFKPGDSLYEERPSQVRKQRLRDLIKPPAGISIVPFWQRRRLRPNPFIACEKTDDNSDE
jgi:hypothetical protein